MKIKNLFTHCESVLGLLAKTLPTTSLWVLLLAAQLTSPLVVAADEVKPSVLVTLTSAEPQTQGMALVLSNAMQAQGAEVHMLLCDEAGHLAIRGSESVALAPREISPKQMLDNLMQGGANVEVCALFLPNAGLSEDALLPEVKAAQPPSIAGMMLDPKVRVFNF